MFTSCEKRMLAKGYKPINYGNIWSFVDPNDCYNIIYVHYNKEDESYVFSYGLKNSNMSYKSTFYQDNVEKMEEYVNYIVNDYL
jgi:hypothetical protein